MEGCPAKLKNFVKPVVDVDLNPSTHYSSITIHNRTNTTFSKWPIYLDPRHKGEFGHKEVIAKKKLQQQIPGFWRRTTSVAHTHINSIILLGKYHTKHFLHQTSNSSDQKKNQTDFDQLRRTPQQLQTATKITGATSLPWPHMCAPVPQHRACKLQ